MKNLKLYLIALALMLLGMVNAISLNEFYEAVYNADSVSVGAEFMSFLPDAQTIDDIDSALQMWMSYDELACRDWVTTHYKKDRLNRNLGLARVLIETDYATAQSLSKQLILLNRQDPLVYEVLVLSYLYEFTTVFTEEDWNAYHVRLLKDASYFKRYYRLAPESDMALFAKLLVDMAENRLEDAKNTANTMARFNIQLNRFVSFGDLVAYPAWRDLMQYYVGLTSEHINSNGDPESMFDAASTLAGYWHEHEEWSSILDAFADQPEQLGNGPIVISILVAYQKLDRSQESVDLLASYGDGVAADIINWWKTYYPEQGLDDYINGLRTEFPNDPTVDSAYLGWLSDPAEKQNASREYCAKYPSLTTGFKALFGSWGEYFSKELYTNQDSDVPSQQFRADLPLWDSFEALNADEAMASIQTMMEQIYYGEKMINNTLIYTLRPQWIEAPAIQFLSVNTFFNLEDYDSVMRLLNYMLDEHTITDADLDELAIDENPVCKHKDWQSLLEYARSLSSVE